MNPLPTVLIADDDSFMRSLLQRVFANAGIAAESYASANDLLAGADLGAPAVLLLDVMMPGMSGLELQALLRERGVALPVIFLTGSSDIPMAVAAMRNGAVDFLEKPFDNTALIERVRQAFARVAATAAAHVPGRYPEFMQRRKSLTPRESEVADLMVTGMTSKEIARQLGGSFRTVEIHRTSVMSKMAAANLADLVRMTFTAESAT
jgi:FixJ family two-component response regulator